MNSLKYIIEGNWDEIKGKIQTQWGKLTDSDIEKIDGSYKTLIGRLQKLYGYKLAEVEDELAEFCDSSEFVKIKRQLQNKTEEIKSVVWNTLEEYFQTVKQGSMDAEKAMVEYVKQNPLKLIGVAAVTGLLVGCLCKNNKN